MKYQREHLQKLISKVKEKSGAGDYTIRGFNEMAEDLKEAGYTFDPKYLKYKLYDGDSKSVRESRLDDLSVYLGYKNYKAFTQDCAKEVDPILNSIIGNYYSYVRMNHEEGNLLRSPVRISLTDGYIHFHQKGGRLEFRGKVEKHEGCLFVLMVSDEGKSFYHIYRIGSRKAPEVLQGIFSGVSTDFKPIGGRAVLLKSTKAFETLKTGVLDIKKMLKSKREEDLALAKYFQHRKENNLSIKGSANFSLRDLRGD